MMTSSFLPQLDCDRLFVTDGGMETTIVFHEGVDLPYFASFVMMESESRREYLRSYFVSYIRLARQYGADGIVLEAPTWRASSGWGNKLGYSAQKLADVNCDSIDLMRGVRDADRKGSSHAGVFDVVISGCVGPAADAYRPEHQMTAQEAHQYHTAQAQTLRQAGADVITGMTIAYAAEGLGIALAAAEAGMPCVISFTTETDGTRPSGETLQHAVDLVDRETACAGSPAYYMVNCAHPYHLDTCFAKGQNEQWARRIRGVRCNASSKSHAELDACDSLDVGDIATFGTLNRSLRAILPHVNIWGGCCGTDERHIEELLKALANPNARVGNDI